MVISFKDGITGVCVTRPDPQRRGGPCAPGMLSRPLGGPSAPPCLTSHPCADVLPTPLQGPALPGVGVALGGSPRNLVTCDSTPGGQGTAQSFGGKHV